MATAREHGKEWWRRRYAATLAERSRLEAYLAGRTRSYIDVYGSEAWSIKVRANNVYAFHRKLRYQGRRQKLVGKLYGKYFVIHEKRAPRWLKNWARFRPYIYVLPKLDRGTLAAHLMRARLLGEAQEELPF